ncbi:MAG: SHOCT domain-containing protein [Betaproteobacteria bacterium]|nr:SHOCT domain-containing protein [Betaproteobacteria bacterium]MDE2151889.1 SHOCT domain-containing protein [Betaproteobacteria bacterium]
MTFKARAHHLVALATLGAAAVLAQQPAQAGIFDGLLGSAHASEGAPSGQTTWQISHFSFVRIVPEEAGAKPNSQPLKLDRDALAKWLEQIHFTTSQGQEHLFASDEARSLAPALVEAFANARPNQDIVFSSASRRGRGFLVGPTAVTARVFVRDGFFNLIVHDARDDFYDQYRGTLQMPTFTYGSRTEAGKVQLSCPDAVNVKADWIRLPLNPGAVPQPTAPSSLLQQPAAAPGALVPAPAQPMQQPMQQPMPQAAQPAPNSPEGIEHRLAVLKDAYQRGLITKQEYEAKREELVKQF